ncbi:hypothetical protein BrE312_2875 [Brenneria sp. EniD312]|nr:hypothetical protein BrE312_2875 [Brenneria sp. EniD312]
MRQIARRIPRKVNYQTTIFCRPGPLSHKKIDCLANFFLPFALISPSIFAEERILIYCFNYDFCYIMTKSTVLADRIGRMKKRRII